MSIVILGSLNMDVVFRCKALPKPGETVLSQGYETGPGGKGLNQAVAARRAGSDVQFIGAVGADSYGSDLLSFLETEGIDCGAVQQLDGVATGLAHIVVDELGENAIIVASGANSATLRYSIEAAPHHSISLVQLEVPALAVAQFLEESRKKGRICMLNAAPVVPETHELLPLCDIIIVNEHELADLAQAQCDASNPDSLEQACLKLVDIKKQTMIVTLGAEGTAVFGPESYQHVPAVRVQPVDTTGAGDCFCGVLADGLSRNMGMIDAVARANRAAAIAVQHPGAAKAMPTDAEISAFS